MAPLPTPPAVVTSDGCQHPPTITWTEEDLANELVTELPCLSERLDERGCVGERMINTFDARGRVTRAEVWVIDPDVNRQTYGEATSVITTYGYDELNRPTERAHDLGADGIVDVRDLWSYDPRGRVVVEIRERPEGTRRTERAYDDEDRVTLEITTGSGTRREVQRAWHDSGAILSEHIDVDGVRTYTRTHTFDERGRRLLDRLVWVDEGREETTEYVYDHRGLIHRTWRRVAGPGPALEERHAFTRWPNGALRSELYEQIVHGDQVNRRSRSAYDAEERELYTEWDNNVDGAYETGRRYSYDAEGRRLTEFVFDRTRTLTDVRYEYDAEGRPVVRTDLVAERVIRTTYEGRVIRAVTEDLQGRRLSEKSTTYDDDDRAISVASDLDGDGVVDRYLEHTWTDGGQPLRTRGDHDADGVWDYEAAQTYDRADQLLYAMTDHDADGRPERAQLLSYACQRANP